MTGKALVDTNILVYRFDPRFPEKQARATSVLRRGLRDATARIPHPPSGAGVYNRMICSPGRPHRPEA